MESGYDINHLAREAQTRWLKPVEVFFILKNYEEHQLTHQIPQKPTSGSLYLFNKRVLKFFRKDGHNWRRRRDQRTIAEAHERLKVGNIEALNCYYAHGEENHNFQRRSYWILDPAYEHIVLVHYRDIGEAHVRGYQVRKNYKVCWAVGILEKVVLRWRRKGVGLRGFRQDLESVDVSDDEDILKVFRKQKVDAEIDEAVSRVLSMVESTEARQQYHRILEKYRQAKAELESAESDTGSSSQQNFSPDHGISHMENVESYRLR